MELVQIDMIRAQSPEASFRSRNQVTPPKISGKHFRREKYLMPPASDRVAYDLFSVVRFRRVYESSPARNCCAERLDASLVVPSTESDFGHANARFSQLF